MKEVKFRAWHPDKKLMEYDDFHIGWSGIFYGWDVGENDYHLKKSEVVLMQSTGIKDKDGKEIYEEDLVRYRIAKTLWSFPREAIYQVTKARFAIRVPKRMGVPVIGIYKQKKYEVIGNTYENPELLTHH